MRMSDWSSDVCSSDLKAREDRSARGARAERAVDQDQRRLNRREHVGEEIVAEVVAGHRLAVELTFRHAGRLELHGVVQEIRRASARERVCSTGRSRWSPYL